MYSRQGAFDWAVQMCNAPDVGYSQRYRNYKTVDGITYFDCSSFMFFALWLGGGLDVGSLGFSTTLSDYQNGLANAWVVATMVNYLRQLGWQQISMSDTSLWLPGDILVKTRTHTEMINSMNPMQSMGARNSSLPLADQVAIHSFSTGYYDQIWRDPETINSWIVRRSYDTGGQYLNSQEQTNNAVVAWFRLAARGAYLSSVCAMLASFQALSTINPGFENLSQPASTRGIGIAQWEGTRHANLESYCTAQGLSTWADGDAQVEFLWSELANLTFSISSVYAEQIIPVQYRFTDGRQFATNSDDGFSLAMRVAWWLCAFELNGGSSVSQSEWETLYAQRLNDAETWYNYLSTRPRVHGPMPAWLLKRAIQNGGVYI